jgi:hypothetical protein
MADTSYSRFYVRITCTLFSLFCYCLAISPVEAQENAAPSMHLVYDFPSQDAVLKMQKIKIVQSANASYFEVNAFTDGYAGLQQTSDGSYGNPISCFHPCGMRTRPPSSTRLSSMRPRPRFPAASAAKEMAGKPSTRAGGS